MVGEVAGKKLYDAAAKGDATTLEELLQENPDLLDGVLFQCSNRSPLHVDTMQGNEEIVEIMLSRNTQLAEELDSQKSSPLHIAAAKGYVGIASKLVSVAPRMCWSRDCHGMNPIHIAAMNGHVEILKKLIEADPFPAREKLGRGQTVMHLCVKHRQVRAFQFLAENLGVLVRARDEDGDTVLHLAVRYNQLEIIEYLVESNKIGNKSRDAKGKTPLQILDESPPDTTTSHIREILRISKGLSDFITFDNLNDVLMVAVILIATMAFQSIVSPPGGVWQEDSSLHKAGDAVMASKHPEIYKHFVRANTVAFVSSMTVIILLTTNFPSENKLPMWALTIYATWMSLAAIAVSYGASVMVITPNTQTQSLNLVINVVIAVCVAPMVIVLVYVNLPEMWKRFVHKFPRLSQTCTRYWVSFQQSAVVRDIQVRMSDIQQSAVVRDIQQTARRSLGMADPTNFVV